MAGSILPLVEFEQFLVAYFSRHLGAPREAILESRNLKRDYRISDQQWGVLIDGLLREPAMAHLSTPPERASLQAQTSVQQLARLLWKAAPSATEGVNLRDPGARTLIRLDRDNNAEITVWYATNRKPADPGDAMQGFTSEHDTTMHYGTCKVFVPASHEIGSLGSSWIRRLIKGADDRLKLRGIASLEPDDYWSQIRNYLQSLPDDERHAVVFMHGYNVSFADAALRAAQIGCDLAIPGIVALYSWPSRGSLKGYTADEATIEACEPQLTQFLQDVVQRSGASKIHLIAHSMGNRGLLRAISNLAEKIKARSFAQIVLAAADVDSRTFANLHRAYVASATRTTLYVSSRDHAVEASKWLHDFARVGLTPPVAVFPDIDTVNVTHADITRLGHGYVGEARGVLSDIHELLLKNSPPSQRFGLRPLATDGGMPYWEVAS